MGTKMPIDKNEITKEMLEKAMQCNTVEELIAYAKTEGVEKDGDLKHIAGGKYTRGSWCNEFCVDWTSS